MALVSAAPPVPRAEAARVAPQAESRRGRAAGWAFDGTGPRAVAGRVDGSAEGAAGMELATAGRG
jgi:hypothetical protein